jgi:glutamate/tyrosine decarboxylase-like PLP-dependent enzyme
MGRSTLSRMSYDALFDAAHGHAAAFLAAVGDRPVHARTAFAELVTQFGGALPEAGEDAVRVIDALARDADPGIVATAGPRYFGFVTGGSYPVAVAAEWLVSAWDQNAALHVMSPAISAIEEVAARWTLEALSLPATASVGFVTGAHTANVTALAAARHEVLRRDGWDVEERGLQGAPRITVIAGAEAHASIPAACRMIGLGAGTIVRVESDDQGRMRADALEAALSSTSGPRIVCAQAGNVNTGASDPLARIAAGAHDHGAWLHVDGAFGLWAAAAPDRRHLVAGIERADSWTTDAHKWLNVPYDSGIVIVAHPAAHRAAMSQRAAYLIPAEGEQRDGMDWVPEASRRARVVPIYAVLRSLGRAGLRDLIERCCRLAARMASRLRDVPQVSVLNDVVLNQVLVRFGNEHGENTTGRVISRIQADGECWCGGTSWGGQPAMRISVSSWLTTEEDADRSVEAILRAHAVTNNIAAG